MNIIRCILEAIETRYDMCLTQRTADRLNKQIINAMQDIADGNDVISQRRRATEEKMARAAGLTPVNTTNLWS